MEPHFHLRRSLGSKESEDGKNHCKTYEVRKDGPSLSTGPWPGVGLKIPSFQLSKRVAHTVHCKPAAVGRDHILLLPP